jgi:hypothetical protein
MQLQMLQLLQTSHKILLKLKLKLLKDQFNNVLQEVMWQLKKLYNRD